MPCSAAVRASRWWAKPARSVAIIAQSPTIGKQKHGDAKPDCRRLAGRQQNERRTTEQHEVDDQRDAHETDQQLDAQGFHERAEMQKVMDVGRIP